MAGELTLNELEVAQAEYLAIISNSTDEWTLPDLSYPTSRLTNLYPELSRVTIEDVTFADPNGSVPMRRYSGPGKPTSTLMWVHGGAFVFGTLDMPEANWVSLTLAGRGYQVFSVDYRKALEGVHYPAPADDLAAAWQWIADQNPLHETASGEIHLGGASAGAALSAGLVVRLRDSGERVPDSVILAYPIVHPRLPEMSPELRAATTSVLENGSYDAHIIDGMSYNFAGSLRAFQNPQAFAGLSDPTGFPPTLIINSEHDILRASGELFAKQLSEVGATVLSVTEAGSLHGQLNEPENPAGIRSLERIAEWLATRR